VQSRSEPYFGPATTRQIRFNGNAIERMSGGFKALSRDVWLIEKLAHFAREVVKVPQIHLIHTKNIWNSTYPYMEI
jgi:hypothetical protein